MDHTSTEVVRDPAALWRAWEHLRVDPATGLSIWWRHHDDPHLAVLLDPDGPFKGSSTDRGHAEAVNRVIGHGLNVSDDDDPCAPRHEDQIPRAHLAQAKPKEVTHGHVRSRHR